MKRILFVLVLVSISVITVQSQYMGQSEDMKIGVSASLPLGDFSNAYSFGAQADFAYLFQMKETFKVGPMASLIYYNGDNIGGEGSSIKIKDALFLPIGAHARYLFDDFFVGADLGYAIGLSPSGMSGGALIRPKVGYNFGNLAAVASYSAITQSGTVGSLNFGIEFSF